MLNRQSTFFQNLQNRNGQVALFIALIFQILFLFFAMVINVGLLVHHKINLQNSVDLAAYYGAMKQAEGMNVIAHTNYQIRQSWKLLAWRYRMLGTAGDFEEHPFDKFTKGLRGSDDDGINPARPGYYDAPAFCITYIPFKPMPPGENTCKDMFSKSGISVFRTPNVWIDLPSVSNSVRILSEVLRSKAFERCRDFGSFNYVMLGNFVVAFNIDQANRMSFLSYLSHAMSPDSPQDDFFDIDGQSVYEGMKQTLLNNLTSANRDSITSNNTLKIYNSLGNPNCNRAGVEKGLPAKWLVPVRILPGFVYTDTECNQGTSRIISSGRMLDVDKSNWPKEYPGAAKFLQQAVSELAPFIGMRRDINNVYNYSLGVEKNPWCMAYVGASATTTPKIPFSPFNSVTLKARAFYKPFGGRIGPWYFDKWTSREVPSKGSGPGERVDPNVPPRVYDAQNVGDPNDPTRAANYSRFAGDKIGLKSRRVLYQYGKAIYGLDPSWASQIKTNGDIEADTTNAAPDSSPNFDHWAHLPFNFYQKGGSQDIMAWDSVNNRPTKMRELEMSAILPDAYDFAYYSIQPNFYQTYYTRLRDGFLKNAAPGYYSQGGNGGQREFLGDLGTHKGYKDGSANFDEFSVKDQYTVVKNSAHLAQYVDIQQKLTYLSTAWEHALTGWAPKSLMDYSLDTDKKFGKCTVYPEGAEKGNESAPVKVATSGNCVAGGSAGYSVKMVSSDFLKSEIPNIGGDGVNGQILNPPPSDDEF